MKRLSFLIALVFFVCVSATEVHACICATEDKVRLKKINSAEFVGIFKVLESNPSKFKSDGIPAMKGMKSINIESGTAYKIEPLVTYKGSISSKDIVHVNHNNDCNPGEMKIGLIYRGLIIKNKYGVLTLPSICTYITHEEWGEFEKKATKVANEWISFEVECERQGKLIRSESEMRCSKKTDDKGKACKDSSECEGFCAVPYAEYKYSTQDLIGSLNGESPKRPAIGKCSEWTDSADGMLVRRGYTQR